MGAPVCYLACMLCERIRRILALVFALSLALGIVLHSTGSMELGVKPAMTAAASDMSMPGNCDGCGDHAGMLAVCAIHCGGVVALPTTIVLSLGIVAVDILGPAAGQQATGHIGPPDPYPPRPIGMS